MGEYLSDVVHKVAFLANSSVYCQPTTKASKGLHFKTSSTTFCAHIPTMALKVNDDQKQKPEGSCFSVHSEF